MVGRGRGIDFARATEPIHAPLPDAVEIHRVAGSVPHDAVVGAAGIIFVLAGGEIVGVVPLGQVVVADVVTELNGIVVVGAGGVERVADAIAGLVEDGVPRGGGHPG